MNIYTLITAIVFGISLFTTFGVINKWLSIVLKIYRGDNSVSKTNESLMQYGVMTVIFWSIFYLLTHI